MNADLQLAMNKLELDNPRALLLIDATQLSRITAIPLERIHKLLSNIQIHPIPFFYLKQQSKLTTMNDKIDSFFNGGLLTNHIYEIYGESGTGKSQFTLLLLLSCQLPLEYGGLNSDALVINTSNRICTVRLSQLITNNASFGFTKDNLDRIHVLNCRDQETLQFLLKYHIPNFIKQNNIRLLVLDSITSNFRGMQEEMNVMEKSIAIYEMGDLLKKMASEFDMVVVVVNEVVANFCKPVYISGLGQGALYESCIYSNDLNSSKNITSILNTTNTVTDTSNIDTWTSNYINTDTKHTNNRNTSKDDENLPCLGGSLTSIIQTRIQFLKDSKRRMKIIFSPMLEATLVEFEITNCGLS